MDHMELCEPKQTRGRSWIAVRMKMFEAPTPEDARLWATAVRAKGYYSILCFGKELLYMQHYPDKMKLKVVKKPADSEAEWYNFPRQNQHMTKLTEFMFGWMAKCDFAIGTIQITVPIIEDVDFESVMAFLTGYKLREFSIYVANARLARKAKKQDAMQVAVLTVESQAHTFVKGCTSVQAFVRKVDTVKFEFPDDFAPNIEGLEVLFLDPDSTAIQRVTLGHFLTSPMYLDLFLWVIGRTKSGKSELVKSLARRFCDESECASFVMTPGFDHVGTLTKTGQNMQQGSFIFDDCKLTSKYDQTLKLEDMLNLGLVGQAGTYPCRYTDAELPPLVPRMGTANAGVDDRGDMDFGDHFIKYEMAPLAALARGKESYFKHASDFELGVARRFAVLNIHRADQIRPGVAEPVVSQSVVDARLQRAQLKKQLRANAKPV